VSSASVFSDITENLWNAIEVITSALSCCDRQMTKYQKILDKLKGEISSSQNRMKVFIDVSNLEMNISSFRCFYTEVVGFIKGLVDYGNCGAIPLIVSLLEKKNYSVAVKEMKYYLAAFKRKIIELSFTTKYFEDNYPVNLQSAMEETEKLLEVLPNCNCILKEIEAAVNQPRKMINWFTIATRALLFMVYGYYSLDDTDLDTIGQSDLAEDTTTCAVDTTTCAVVNIFDTTKFFYKILDKMDKAVPTIELDVVKIDLCSANNLKRQTKDTIAAKDLTKTKQLLVAADWQYFHDECKKMYKILDSYRHSLKLRCTIRVSS